MYLNFDNFIDQLSLLESPERMVDEIEGECRRVEAYVSRRVGNQKRVTCVDYLARLKRVGFWFHHGSLAPGGRESGACLRIAEKLTERKQLKSEALVALHG